ncbi:MAG: exodeoxyribonuclease VII large subunit, partial [Desulfobulbus sp.]|nr:exodeoxyribonuclease VII large subunit [Desulfobulbus sp.]
MYDLRLLTVSELNTTIRSLLEGSFPFVSVVGEISNVHRPFSGHLYFTLKDTNAQIRAVLFKIQQRYLTELPADGAQVICRGRISVYEPRGDYQLIVDTIEPRGAGALQQAFADLKHRLAAEGLFDAHLKRPLPPYPRHITLITSPHGAAVHDFIHIATRRFPPIRIAVYPAAVQGDQAARDIIEALATINSSVATDLIVLCRGGGSLEDLWAFNDEQLARAIRRSTVPVVSAVGHEIDFTIADFAADFRAPTPSGAAELLVPDGSALRKNLDDLRVRMTHNLRFTVNENSRRLQLARQRLLLVPHLLDRLCLHLDHLSIRLKRSFIGTLVDKQHDLDQAALHLTRLDPKHRYDIHRQQLHNLKKRLIRAGASVLLSKRAQLTKSVSILDAVSPLATLARGYSVVRLTKGRRRLITEAKQVQIGTLVEILLHQG